MECAMFNTPTQRGSEITRQFVVSHYIWTIWWLCWESPKWGTCTIWLFMAKFTTSLNYFFRSDCRLALTNNKSLETLTCSVLLGIWEYIENLREHVMDLDQRVNKAQQNAKAINQLMKKWETLPLFTRYDDGRTDNLFNTRGDLSPFHLQITASVRERQLQATWALLLWATWLAAAVREPTLLFVTERGLSGYGSDNNTVQISCIENWKLEFI